MHYVKRRQLPVNIGGLTTRWSGPGMRRPLRVKEKIGEPGKACEDAIPGRSLVPAAQAQAARSR